MANVTIPDITALGANVSSDDLFEISDTSNSAASRRVTQLEILQGLTITPTTSGVLTIANSKTFSCSNTLTLTGTDGSSVSFGAGGTVIYSGGALGTPSSGTLSNCSGLPVSTGVSGLGTGVATFLGTPSSANLASCVTGETGSGALVFATSPALTTPNIGTPSAGVLTSCTGLPVGGISATGTPSGTTFLRGDGTWSTPAGSGTITGPVSSTVNAVVIWDSTDGTQVENSVVTIDPVSGDMANVGNITGGALAVTSAAPVSNDGAALGSGAVSWSDLFLASGGLINFANGNAVVTHSSGILTVSTGDLRVTTAGTNSASCVTVGGTQTLTGKSIAVTQLTAGVLGGTITLGEGTGNILLDNALSADGTWSGVAIAGTAGATLAFGDIIYFSVTDSRWELADADAASTAGDVMLGICVLAAASDGSATTVLLQGMVRADAVFPTFTIGAPVYVGTTAGDVQVAQPSATDDVIRVAGYGFTADVLYFNPSGSYITHT